MSIYKALFEGLVLPLGDIVTGGSFISKLRKYRKEQFLDYEQVNKLQKDRLRALLHHATTNIPFYSNVDFTDQDDPFEAVRKFPIMRKPLVRDNIDRLTWGPKEQYIKENSSGSSGIQGTVYLNKESQSVQRAIQILWWEWAGYEFGNPLIQTGITPNRGLVKSIKDKLLNTTYVSAYNLGPEVFKNVLDKVKSNPKYHINGYASSLYLIAKYANEQNLPDLKIRSSVSWGDKLFDHFRSEIVNTFHAPVHDTYACTEGVMIAAQCQHGTYHMFQPQNYVEILDDAGNPVPDGEMGHVVVTRLDNYAMPLIRYYLGDLAILRPGPYEVCACGRHLKHLQKVIGRDTDIVKSRTGKFLIVHAFTGVFEHEPNVLQFRVVQRSLDYIDIEYIPSSAIQNSDLDRIKSKIHALMDEKFPINFIQVEHIPPTPSGKPQIIQSFLNQSQAVNQTI